MKRCSAGATATGDSAYGNASQSRTEPSTGHPQSQYDTAVENQAWKAEGRVRYIGITHYTASAHAQVERWLKTGVYNFLQINHSLAEREAEQRLLPLAAEQRVAVIINRPFAEGAIFARAKGKPIPASRCGSSDCDAQYAGRGAHCPRSSFAACTRHFSCSLISSCHSTRRLRSFP